MPTNDLLTERVPNHPVHAGALHGFASIDNDMALELAGITAATEPPVGGRIVKENGEPTGVLLDNATDLVTGILPEPTHEQRVRSTRHGLQAMADMGYVAVHDAGVRSSSLAAYQELDRAGELPVRAYMMLSISDEELIREWIARGPEADPTGMLAVRSVKAYYDASLGARGARLLEDYSDRPGHRGVSGDDYGFDQELARDVMAAGFQIGIHAIGDAGNRETLDFFDWVYETAPEAIENRNRIEHAQIVHSDDQARFAPLGIIASMEPPHQAEDMAWAEDRLGPERAAHGYAWRSLRQQGARLIFNSDLSGSDPNIFYGLHAAITRRDKRKQPEGGWFPAQVLSPEEAIRAYTSWAAYAAFAEKVTGRLAPGYLADLTVMDIDPFVVGETEPGRLLEGEVLMTVVGGEIRFEAGQTEPVPALYTNPLVLPAPDSGIDS
jgi:predicted amidohydrolase YtcJ